MVEQRKMANNWQYPVQETGDTGQFWIVLKDEMSCKDIERGYRAQRHPWNEKESCLKSTLYTSVMSPDATWIRNKPSNWVYPECLTYKL
jgi:hypothetical protein